jgi:hypothetical protein
MQLTEIRVLRTQYAANDGEDFVDKMFPVYLEKACCLCLVVYIGHKVDCSLLSEDRE